MSANKRMAIILLGSILQVAGVAAFVLWLKGGRGGTALMVTSVVVALGGIAIMLHAFHAAFREADAAEAADAADPVGR